NAGSLVQSGKAARAAVFLRESTERKIVMKVSHTLLAAAVGGLLAGCGGAPTPPSAPSASPPSAGSAAAAAPGAKHACKGQNDCKGQGGGKSDKHACKGQNDCKGQGGCKG